jgi:hypothetical protein
VIPGVHLTGGGGNGGDPSDPWTYNYRPGVDLDGGGCGCGRQLSLICHMRLDVADQSKGGRTSRCSTAAVPSRYTVPFLIHS